MMFGLQTFDKLPVVGFVCLSGAVIHSDYKYSIIDFDFILLGQLYRLSQ